MNEGFRISPLLRFKSDERSQLLNDDFLESLINERYQVVSNKQKAYYKCSKNLLSIFDNWEDKSTKKMRNYLVAKSNYAITVPTTCRYFMVGSKKNLQRDGKRVLYVKNKEYYNYIYAMFNSSFAYWYWRIYDGGINCPLTIINNIPMFYDILSPSQKKELDAVLTLFAERGGFEPPNRFRRLHAFQACQFSHSCIFPMRGQR